MCCSSARNKGHILIPHIFQPLHRSLIPQHSNTHMKIEQKPTVKPFQCSFCGRAFPRKGHVRQHVRDVHEKVPYPCPHCDKIYRSNSSLHKHVKMLHSFVHHNDVQQRDLENLSDQLPSDGAHLRNVLTVDHTPYSDTIIHREQTQFSNTSHSD